MKTKEEIQEEIQASHRTDANYRKAYKQGKITKDILVLKLEENMTIRLTLEWVLGNNDRFD